MQTCCQLSHIRFRMQSLALSTPGNTVLGTRQVFRARLNHASAWSLYSSALPEVRCKASFTLPNAAFLVAVPEMFEPKNNPPFTTVSLTLFNKIISHWPNHNDLENLFLLIIKSFFSTKIVENLIRIHVRKAYKVTISLRNIQFSYFFMG